MARERVHVIGFASADPAAVWSVAREFCEGWHPLVDRIRAETDSRGSVIRAFSVRGEGGVYRERLSYFSDSDRVLGYSLLEGIAGVESYDARLTVSPAEDAGSVMTWSANISARSERIGAIAAGTRTIFETGMTALGAVAARGMAPASKRPAEASPARISTLSIDSAPRLSLTTTAGRDGPLCLFLHGIGGGKRNWTGQLDAVGGTMRAAALDLRGYGGSSLGIGQSTIDDYCADIVRVADVLGAPRLVLCGLSYGSWIATSFAMRHPERLAGLVLSGGCTGMSEAGPDEREAFRLSREVPLDAGQTPADFAPAVVKVLAGPGASDAVRAELASTMAAIPATTYRDALVCFTNPLERFDFARLTMPVLMMTGEHDRLAPPAEIRGVAGRIADMSASPDVRFEVIAGAGHVCNLEQPGIYNNLLVEFLGRLAR